MKHPHAGSAEITKHNPVTQICKKSLNTTKQMAVPPKSRHHLLCLPSKIIRSNELLPNHFANAWAPPVLVAMETPQTVTATCPFPTTTPSQQSSLNSSCVCFELPTLSPRSGHLRNQLIKMSKLLRDLHISSCHHPWTTS